MVGLADNLSIAAKGYAVVEASDSFKLLEFNRHDCNPTDVLIRIHYCGICHTDIHMARNDWKNSKYPMIPGHEITGIIEKIGSDVTKFEVGDHAGVGYMINSCRSCDRCTRNFEQHCPNLCTTFNGTIKDTNTYTYGGYSNLITVDENFVCKIPKNLPLDSSAPLLCAGISVYSPLKQYNIGENTHVGVVGLGGLGHIAVKFASIMGAHVTVISTSESKRSDAFKLGAKEFVCSKNQSQMEKMKDSLDFILDTVSSAHNVGQLIDLLKFEGTFCMVGASAQPIEIPTFSLLLKRPIITGSAVGSIKATQAMLDFCGKHEITCNIESITATPDSIRTAFERILQSDIKYRFVLDIKNSFH